MNRSRPFAEETFRALLDLVAARTPTPGGGSVAALCGSLGAALGCMAVRFSMKRKESTPEQDAVLATLERGLVGASERLNALADLDSDAFESLREARKRPQASEPERAARESALRAATARAAEIPLQTARLCREAMEMIAGALPALNARLATDVGSGILLLRAAGRCAGWNVRVNLAGESGPETDVLRSELDRLLARGGELEAAVEQWTLQALGR